MDSDQDLAGLRPQGASEVPTGTHPRLVARLRRMILAAIVLILVQSGIGMDVNLFVAIPTQHPGARPSSYFSGSVRSVAWAVAHGAPALVVHAALGLALALLVIGVAVYAIRLGRSLVGAGRPARDRCRLQRGELPGFQQRHQLSDHGSTCL